MTKHKKEQRLPPAHPIPINHKAYADLPLPLRELADLLSDLALKQLNDPCNPQDGEVKDDQ